MVKKSVLRFLNSRNVKPGSSILIGFSGGPDSTCLLAVLKDIAVQFDYKLTAAYIDHGIREQEERERELAHVQKFAERFGIPLRVRRIKEGLLVRTAHREKTGLEESARARRYAFFNQLKREETYDYLCLGHNLDDQIETIIMRIFQGSGPAGLAGIPAVNGWILRPLLGCSRKDIERHLAEEGLETFPDSTNEKNRFLRNRIRHELIPVLQGIFPGLNRALSSLGRKARIVNRFFKEENARLLDWRRTDTGVRIGLEDFFKAPAAVRMESLYRQFGMLGTARDGLGGKRLPFRFIRPLLGEKRDGISNLPLKGHGVAIHGDRKDLFLERDIVLIRKIGYFIHVEQGIPFTLFGHSYMMKIKSANDDPAETICALDAQSVTPPIVIRPWKPGDRIFLGFGNKKLKKLFVDFKIPKEKKEKIPIVADAEGIVAVLGEFAGSKNVIRRGAAPVTCNKGRATLVFLREKTTGEPGAEK